ncbi:MAG: ATP-binding protein, partial [Pyrinomonadaceae bacterium]
VSTTALEMISQETIPPSKERMLREMGDALASLATGSTVILLLEDLHWADPSSIDLLRHLGQRARDHRLLIVGTFPHGDVEASGHPLRMFKLEMEAHQQCEEIALGALGREHVAAYLNARFSPNDFPCQLATLIQRKTEGHSLFAFSLIQFLAESGDIARTDGLWSLARPLSEMDIEAPENVRSMIRKKIEALADEDRRMLQYASVEGEEFTSTVVAALLGVDDLEVEERLAAVERIHRMIVTCGEEELPDGGLATRYRFAHALYQHVLYGDLVSKRRILLHRQAGEQLLRQYGAQSARVAAQLALHFERGRDFKRAVAHLCAAGENATRLFANAVAVEHYDHALRLAEKLAEEEQAGVSLMLHQKRGAANHSLGKFQQAAEDFTEMLELARSLGSAAQESAALNALTMTLFYSHRLDEITARADEILRAAERAGSESLRVEAMQVLALKHLGQGELAAARPMLDEIIRGARALDLKPVLLTGLAWRGILHFFQTEYEVAAEVLAEARRLAGELRDSFLLLETYFVLGMVRGNQGRMSDAIDTFTEGLKLAHRYGDQFWSPRMPNCVGWIYRELQDFGEAIRHDREGLEIGRQHGVVEAQANSLINLGVDYGHAGESEKTPAAFGKVEGIFRRDDWFSWRYRLRLLAGKCEHRLSRRDFAKAEAHAQALLEEASRYEARKYTAVAHKLLAQLAAERGDLAAAEDHLSAAIAQLH